MKNLELIVVGIVFFGLVVLSLLTLEYIGSSGPYVRNYVESQVNN